MADDDDDDAEEDAVDDDAEEDAADDDAEEDTASDDDDDGNDDDDDHGDNPTNSTKQDAASSDKTVRDRKRPAPLRTKSHPSTTKKRKRDSTATVETGSLAASTVRRLPGKTRGPRRPGHNLPKDLAFEKPKWTLTRLMNTTVHICGHVDEWIERHRSVRQSYESSWDHVNLLEWYRLQLKAFKQMVRSHKMKCMKHESVSEP